MTAELDQLLDILNQKEDEHLECKEAKGGFDLDKLIKYCVALANEEGGRIVLGVTDKRPRTVVGTQAFPDLAVPKRALVERLHLRVDVQEIGHPGGRVLLFEVPSRPVGMPIRDKGIHWMRRGQDLVVMTDDMLSRILAEAVPDYSAEVCAKATVADLDPECMRRFRAMWRRKSGNDRLDALTDEQVLQHAELLQPEGLTYAALVLLGRRSALGRYLACAEIVFEYRAGDASGPAQERREYREGFLAFHDDLWEAIGRRNDRQPFQDGLFIWDIPTFNEAVIREAVLNAVSHRDYRQAESVFLRQYPRRLEVTSPGGFPAGVTEQNILWRQSPRNRRIAETLAKCGLVERSGQGVRRMFEECIKEAKARPDFAGTDDYQVRLTLRGEVQDPAFLRFLERVGREKVAFFSTEHLLLLDIINRDQPIPLDLRAHLIALQEHGVIERVGRARGVRYILSRRFFGFLGKEGVYTRKRGLDAETNKMLLLKHIEDNREDGSPLAELLQVLPTLSRRQVQKLLADLRADGRAQCVGRTRTARWYPAPALGAIAPK